jgi:hypothetical protein
MRSDHLLGLRRIARISAILFTLTLFTVGSIPAAGLAFPGVMHYVAHTVAYALIAIAYGMGWPQRSFAQVAAFVAVIGLVHEITEIVTHHHNFETEDVMVNALAALGGVMLQRFAQRHWLSTQ